MEVSLQFREKSRGDLISEAEHALAVFDWNRLVEIRKAIVSKGKNLSPIQHAEDYFFLGLALRSSRRRIEAIQAFYQAYALEPKLKYLNYLDSLLLEKRGVYKNKNRRDFSGLDATIDQGAELCLASIDRYPPEACLKTALAILEILIRRRKCLKKILTTLVVINMKCQKLEEALEFSRLFIELYRDDIAVFKEETRLDISSIL